LHKSKEKPSFEKYPFFFSKEFFELLKKKLLFTFSLCIFFSTVKFLFQTLGAQFEISFVYFFKTLFVSEISRKNKVNFENHF